MKTMKKKLIAFCAFISTFISMQAQEFEYIDRNFKMDYNFDMMIADNSGAPVSGTVHIEVIDFGVKGKTIIAKYECPALEEAFKKSNEDSQIPISTHMSWSGKDVHLMKSKADWAKGDVYMVMRGNAANVIPGLTIGELLEQKKRVLMLHNMVQSGGINGELRKGISRAAVELYLKEIPGRLEQIGNAGNLRIWTRKVPQMEQSKLTGNYNVNNNKRYADFYFDANDKLVKWFIYQ